MRRTVLGAPRVEVLPNAPVRDLVGVRRDVAAFLGVAPQGPVRRPVGMVRDDQSLAGWLTGPVARSVAVPVDSWGEYRRRFGGFEGPGRLPYAVSAFFDQGGRRAYVVRIVHDHGSTPGDPGRSAASLTGTGGGTVALLAADEGSWGRRLTVGLSFAARPVAYRRFGSTTTQLLVDPVEWVPRGSTLRVRLPSGLRAVGAVASSVEEVAADGIGTDRVLTLQAALSDVPVAVEVVLGRLEVLDRDPSTRRREVVDDVGLRADHPRWLGRALVQESSLVWPDPTTADTGSIVPTVTMDPIDSGPFSDVPDQWHLVEPSDFWDPDWVSGDPAGSGVHCLEEVGEVGLLVAPDLYDPAPLDERDPFVDLPPSGAVFSDCVEWVAMEEEPLQPGLDGLRLDPLLPVDLAAIVTAQRTLADVAARRRDLTLLLDVPPGLSHRQVLEWRAAFDSEHVAAYHPWLDVATPDDARDALVSLGGAAFAAGIVADRELRLGLSHGPANQVAVGAVRPTVTVPPDEHDELHPAGINVFLLERDGVVLWGARTLSRRAELRQLTVARLLAVIRLTLQRELGWVVFEPNGPPLWADVRRIVEGYLGRLFDAGAFAGDTNRDSFFVRCDRTTMTTNDLDNGRLICRIGVAPSEPTEYIDVDLALRTRDA